LVSPLHDIQIFRGHATSTVDNFLVCSIKALDFFLLPHRFQTDALGVIISRRKITKIINMNKKK